MRFSDLTQAVTGAISWLRMRLAPRKPPSGRVPRYTAQGLEPDCGPRAAGAVLEYFGVPVGLDVLRSEMMNTYGTGTSTSALAASLKKRLSVDVVWALPSSFGVSAFATVFGQGKLAILLTRSAGSSQSSHWLVAYRLLDGQKLYLCDSVQGYWSDDLAHFQANWFWSVKDRLGFTPIIVCGNK